MFVQLAALLTNPRAIVVLNVCRVNDTHIRVSVHPHADDPKDLPNLSPVAFEGTPQELDGPDISFEPLIEATLSINAQIAAAAEDKKKQAAAPATPATPATPAANPAAPTTTPVKAKRASRGTSLGATPTPAAAPSAATPPAPPTPTDADLLIAQQQREADEKKAREEDERKQTEAKLKELQRKAESASLRAQLQAMDDGKSKEEAEAIGKAAHAAVMEAK